MQTDDAKELDALIQRRMLYGELNISVIVACVIVAIIAAATATKRGASILVLVLCGVFALLVATFIIFNATVVLKHSRKIKRALCNWIAESFETHPSLLQGEEVKLSVRFDEYTMMVERKGEGGVEFNLAPIKKLTYIYSSFGTYVLAYLEAYCRIYQHKIKNFWVSDCTGKQAADIALVCDGKPADEGKSNYFIKSEIIK